MSRSRGVTLVELLVGVSLFTLLMVMFFWFMVPAMRLSGQQAARVEMQQQAALAINRIVAQMQASGSWGISRRDLSPVALAVVPLLDVDSTGQQSWTDRLYLYYWDQSTTRLMEKTWNPSDAPPSLTFSPARPPQPTAAELQTMVATPAAVRSLAQGVSEFGVSAAGLNYTVRLVLSRQTAQRNDPDTFAVARSLTLRQTSL